MVECLVFDIDDTLYLERDYVRSGFQAVGSWIDGRFGVQGFGATCWALFETGVRGSTFDSALKAHDLPVEPGLVRDLVEMYRHHLPEIGLLPDVLRFLSTRRARVLAAITDGPRVAQRQKIRALGLEASLDEVVVTDELGPGMGKPNPAAYARIEDVSGLRGASCCYVADNPFKDFVAPRELGWRTVRIRRMGGLHHGAPSSGDVDAEVASFSELADVLWPQEGAVG